jgi:cobalt/nickel transport system permease protein
MFPRLAMHIPDGFLSVPISAIFWIISLLIIMVALDRVNHELGEREVPVMGVLAAAIFAGQMLNFTVAGGTSGHLMGAALATILLGPWASILVLTAVVSVQALIFQDGGLVVLGANIFNMGIVGSFVSYFIYRIFQRFTKGEKWRIYTGGFFAAWGSIVIASLTVALQLAISGTSPAKIAIPTMSGIHMIIGLGEGLITVGALSFIYAARRDLLKPGLPQATSNRWVWVGGLAITLILAVLSPLASAFPDGLEWVAEEIGFLGSAKDAPYQIIPDYVFPGISNRAIATIVAGVIGALIVLGVTLLLASARRKKTEISSQDVSG